MATISAFSNLKAFHFEPNAKYAFALTSLVLGDMVRGWRLTIYRFEPSKQHTPGHRGNARNGKMKISG